MVLNGRHRQTDCRDERTEIRWQGMGVGLGGSGAGGVMAMFDEGVCEEASGNHCGVCIGSAYIQYF